MNIILQGGPHDQEQRRVDEHTRMIGVDGKWVYLRSAAHILLAEPALRRFSVAASRTANSSSSRALTHWRMTCWEGGAVARAD
jgi:hypothetical protein